MKIEKVDVIPYGVPIRAFSDAYTGFSVSNAVLVKITTDTGIEGFGEGCAWEPEFYGETLESVASTIEKYIAPTIIGENPLNINRILAIIDSNLARITCAKEGVDLALHDLVGKILNVPVYVLLGGKFRDMIPVASEISIDSPKRMAQNTLDVLDLGIRVIKIKGSNDMDLDVKRIHTVREAVGEDIPLRLDPNASWDVPGTIKTMRAVEDCNLQLLEQPVPTWDLKGMAHIRKKIEATAEALGLLCIAGTEIEPGFSLIAKLHLAASMKIHPMASEFTELSLLKENVLDHSIEIINGCVKVPDGPGFGVGLNEEVFKKARLDI